MMSYLCWDHPQDEDDYKYHFKPGDIHRSCLTLLLSDCIMLYNYKDRSTDITNLANCLPGLSQPYLLQNTTHVFVKLPEISFQILHTYQILANDT